MDTWFPLLLIVMLIFAAAGFVWERSRSADILQKWADANGYTILDSEYRTFLTGPFWWNTSKGQTVYRVTVSDSWGYTHTGWVKCGSYWIGLFTDDVQVVWDN